MASWMINSVPKANIREAQGIASRRIGGFSGIVPLVKHQHQIRSFIKSVNLHDELNDDDDPSKTEVPVEPVELI
jgi:hypothetical protein